MNSTSMANLNRMTLLMSISEITPQIFIAGQIAATPEQVQKLGITYILNVAVESSVVIYPKTIKVEKFDIVDFPTAPISNYFNSLTDKIHAHLNANKQNKVLVHCMAGISRSTTIVCAYLIRYMNMSLRDAYLLCKKGRPICFPNLGFWNQLIHYENQLRKESSVKLVPTQFGTIPDLALEEIRQLRAQQQGAQAPLPAAALSPPNPNLSNNNVSSTRETLPNSVRPTIRELTVGASNGVVRSRSLASNSTTRPTVVPSSTYINKSIDPPSLVSTNKSTFVTNRIGLNRSLTNGATSNNTLPPVQSTSSSSYASNRSLPISTSPNIKNRHINHHPHVHHRRHLPHQPSVTVSSTPTVSAGATATTTNDMQRPYYETTYRASFIKPLAP